jgi:hypothetical protein
MAMIIPSLITIGFLSAATSLKSAKMMKKAKLKDE